MIFRYCFLLIIVLSVSTISLPRVGYAQTGADVQTSDLQKSLQTIEDKVEKRRKELGIPGMSLVIVKDDKIIYIKGLGYKDFEKKVAVTPDTQFAIGSSTKAFTALSVLMSADEGKVDLNASPRNYLPYFKMFDPDTDKNMTVRDLMAHTSGLNRTDLAMITGKLKRAELIQVAGNAKPMAKLREKWFYQNIMFAAAGEVVAATQKMPWEKFVPERIFAPLGMTNSNMSVKEMAKAKDFSYGYEYNFDTKETRRLPFRDIKEVGPAGSINSSARDMAEWVRFVLNGGTVNGKRLVSEKGYEEWTKNQMNMTPDGKRAYGLGWFLGDWNGLKVVQHGGNIDGFNALVAMIPEKKLGFVMLTNVTGSPLGGELMPIVWENILGKPEAPKAPAAPGAAVSPEKEIGKYKFQAAGFDVEVKMQDGKLVAIVPGQPTYELQNVGGRKYKLGGAPDGFFVTFKDDSLLLEQPQGNYTLPKIAAQSTVPASTGSNPAKVEAQPAITVDELMAKAIDASGGEANWRKLSSRVMVSDVNMIHQGVTGTVTTYSKSPNKSATETVIFAVGKKIATGFEYFDGANGEEVYTFAPNEKLAGKKLEDARLNSDFYGTLNWKANYPKAEIKGVEKVGEEECYKVELTPEKGTKVTEYYSTKTFLLMKRAGVTPSSTGNGQPYEVIYSDYRVVDGIKLPFRVVNTSPSMGDFINTVRSVKHNVNIKDSVFAPRKLK